MATALSTTQEADLTALSSFVNTSRLTSEELEFLAPRKTRTSTTGYSDLGDVVCRTVEQTWLDPDHRKPSEWAEQERYLNNAPGYVGPWRFAYAPYLREPLDKLVDPELDAVIFVGPAQCGKALALDTPIATPGGWTTMGEITPGDVVFGADGAPTTVVAVSPVMRDHACAIVRFDDGSEIVADYDHNWVVRDLKESCNKGRVVRRKMTTAEVMADHRWQGSRNRFAIDCAEIVTGLPLPPEVLDPYLLGLWLGDGHCLGGRIYAHETDAETYAIALRENGWSVEVQKERTCCVLKIGGDRDGRFMLHQLSELGVINRKHIPLPYLRASYQDRRALLQGLMDSDGHVTKQGACSYCTTKPEIRDGVRELLVSLGYKVRVKSKGGAWNLHFTAYRECQPFRLTRKQERLRSVLEARPTESRSRFIVAIDPISSVPVKCIAVDAEDHLFLAGPSMIPTHNTELILNWAGYSIRAEPSDMTIFSPTQGNARDFSNRRIDRLHRDSDLVGRELLHSRDADNKFDKHYKNGTILGLAWPTKAELAGKPIPRIALTDRDRMEDDIDGEGDPFDLATKRTTSYGSFAMTLCESSPSREITDFRYVPKTAHEAPPTTGILALYNRGDRRRWYMPCGRCGEYLEPRFELLEWDPFANGLDAAETVRLKCPVCEGKIHPDERFTLAQNGLWLPDGCRIEAGNIVGNPRRSKYASYWLEGCSAAFTNWPKLVASYLTAEEEFDATLNEEPLRKFYNTDLGRPYKPKAAEAERTPEEMISRAEDFGRNPETGEIEIISEIAFLAATVDVQKNMFVVQIWGVVPGEPYDLVLVERFDIRKSKRKDEEGDVQWVKPGTYLEDWDLLIDQVIRRSYPMQGRDTRMVVRISGCDSGGKAGVTANAYAFWRTLKAVGLGNRFLLLKGTGTPNAPQVRETFPDASDKKNLATARGDVPVWQLNSNQLKNEANNRLASEVPNKGMVRIPKWNPAWLFKEFCSEVFKDKGWVKAPGVRNNEAWDLLYYVIGLCMTKYIRCERPSFWDKVPVWANPDDPDNPFIIKLGSEPFAERAKTSYDLTEIASKIA